MQELETALLELKTAKTIIELLQDETNSTAPNTTANAQGNLLWFECSKQWSWEENFRKLEKIQLYQTEIKYTARCTTTTINTDNHESFLTTK